MTIEKESNLAIELYVLYVATRAGLHKGDDMLSMEFKPGCDTGVLYAITAYLVAMTDQVNGEDIRTIGGLTSVLNHLIDKE